MGKPLEIQDMQIKIIQKINDHARAFVTGMLSYEKYNTYLNKMTSESEFMIEYIREEEAKILFCGLCKNISIKTEGITVNSVCQVELELISFSYLMDIKKVNRSYQNHLMPYDQLLNVINKDNNASIHGNVMNGKPIDRFVLQYNESNWRFLKRISSQHNESLITDCLVNRPRYKFGIIGDRYRGALEDYTYSVSRDISGFREVAENGYMSKVSELDFIGFHVYTESDEPNGFDVNDSVTYKEINKLYVKESETIIKDYRFLTTCEFRTKNGLKQIPFRNKAICGLSLIGQIIDAKDNQLKLHLIDVDESQSVSTACWFNYATFYSSFYCMPEVGDLVNLHFGSDDESKAVVLNSIKKDPSTGSARRSDD